MESAWLGPSRFVLKLKHLLCINEGADTMIEESFGRAKLSERKEEEKKKDEKKKREVKLIKHLS